MDIDTINVDSKSTRPPKANVIGSNKVIPSTSHFVEPSAPVITRVLTKRNLKCIISATVPDSVRLGGLRVIRKWKIENG